jgi:hydrogenase nickel incorporation protein HypA/HybF
MHELSIALSLVDLACEEAARLAPEHVEAVHVEIGPLSGVVKDALLFSFRLAATGTAIEGSRLEIREVPAMVWCPECRTERVLAQPARRQCPACETPTPELLGGTELRLVALEVGR